MGYGSGSDWGGGSYGGGYGRYYRRGGDCGPNNCNVGWGWGWGWGWGLYWGWFACFGCFLFLAGFIGFIVVMTNTAAATASTSMAASSKWSSASFPQRQEFLNTRETPPTMMLMGSNNNNDDGDFAGTVASLPSDWTSSMQGALDNTNSAMVGSSGSGPGSGGSGWNMVWLNQQGRNFIVIPRMGSHYFGVGIARRSGGKWVPTDFFRQFVSLQGSATVTKNTGEQWDLYAFYANPSFFRNCRETVISFRQEFYRPGPGGGGHGGGGGGGGHGGGGGGGHGGGGGGGGGHGGGGWHGHGGGGGWNGGGGHGGHGGHGHGGGGWWNGNNNWGWNNGGWWGSTQPVYVAQPVAVPVVINPPPTGMPGENTIHLFVRPSGCS